MTLRAQRGWGYIDGSLTAPKNNTPKEEEWLAAHDQIVSALGTMVEASLQCELESIKDATIAWKLLKEKTHSKGQFPIWKTSHQPYATALYLTPQPAPQSLKSKTP